MALALLGCSSGAGAASAPPLADELRAARLLTTTLGPGQIEAVDRVYADILRRHPSEPEARNAWAEHLWNTGRPDQAETQWQEALRLAPGNPDALDGLGHSALRNGNVRAAIEYFREGTAEAPENAGFHYNLANALYIFRREAEGSSTSQTMAQALHHFREAARLEPLNLVYARGYAETFYGLQSPDWMEALTAWERVLELSTDKEFALLHLARVSLKTGNRGRAREYLSKIHSPTYQRVKQRLVEQSVDD